MTADPLAPYRDWRSHLTPDDQRRWQYLLQDAEPLIVDVIRAQVAKVLTGPFGGVETTVADAIVETCAQQALKALLS